MSGAHNARDDFDLDYEGDEDFELDYEGDEDFGLDYDENVGETRRVSVIPWSGEVLDFDDDFGETKQVNVDPNTGEILEHPKPSTPPPAPAVSGTVAVLRERKVQRAPSTPPPIPSDPDRTTRVSVDPNTGEILVPQQQSHVAPAPLLGYSYTSVLIVAVIALVLGASVGCAIALLLFS